MSRRKDRAREQASEPLFGEDWWVADQRLFEDSLARRETPRPPRRRARKRANLRKQEAAGVQAPVQGMLPGFEDPPGADDEPIRADGPAALGAVAARPVRGDRGPGQLLFGPGEARRRRGSAAWRPSWPETTSRGRASWPRRGAWARPGTGRSRSCWRRTSCCRRNRERTRTRRARGRIRPGAWSC